MSFLERLKEIKNILSDENTKKIIGVGDVVKFDNKHFVIIDEIECKLLCIPYLGVGHNKQLEYSNGLWINTKEKFVKVSTLENEDFKNVLNEYRMYILNRKNSRMVNSSSANQSIESHVENNIAIGSIIKTNKFSDETFVVKDKIGKMLVCVSSLDNKGRVCNPIKHYFDIDKVIVVRSKQKRKRR